MVSLSSVKKAISKGMKLKRRELCFKVATETKIESIFCFKQNILSRSVQKHVCAYSHACTLTHTEKERSLKSTQNVT